MRVVQRPPPRFRAAKERDIFALCVPNTITVIIDFVAYFGLQDDDIFQTELWSSRKSRLRLPWQEHRVLVPAFIAVI